MPQSWLRIPRPAIAVSMVVVATLIASTASAAPRVEFELGTAQGFPATSTQRWYELLTELKVDDLRIRTGKAGEEPTIATSGSQANPTYRVTGILTSADELQLPGGKFGVRDRGRLAGWLEKLRNEGPERAAGAPRLAFGLSQQQLAAVNEDLARPVDFATKDVKLVDLLARAGRGLKFPISADAAAAARLRTSPPVQTELRGLARGTALAYVLDQEGLSLAPKLDSRRQVSYAVGASQSAQEAWPVGRPLKGKRADVVPALFEFLNVELQDVSATQALDAVAQRLKVPVLIDSRALEHYKIDLATVKVTMPPKRTTYDATLRKVFTAAKVKEQWREDDAGKPLLWITTPKPVPAGR